MMGIGAVSDGNRVARKLVRLIFPHGARRRVWRGPLAGNRFVVAPGMGASFAMGIDAYNWAFLSQHLGDGDVVYDIGANRGQMALFFATAVAPSGRVYCFEPVGVLADGLRANIDMNSAANLQVLEFALCDYDGERVFEFSRELPTQGKLANVETTYEVDGSEEIVVATRRVDTLVQYGLRPPTMLKIDVEGGAGVVLAGARDTIATYRPDIYVELHGPDEQRAIPTLLAPVGYRFFDMEGKRVDDVMAKWASPLWCSAHR